MLLMLSLTLLKSGFSMSNDFILELNNLGFDVVVKSDEVIITKDKKEVTLTLDKIRKIFINSLITHIDNND